MGSPEGYDQADAAINRATKEGTWVLLKNVHLSPVWLAKLEKRLHRLAPHANFRLFMTMEMNPKVPVTLLRMSNKIVFEPSVGIKSSLRRMFNALSPARVNKAPAERSRLYFLLAWQHAVVLERLRYAPVGWSKEFEFSETDQQCAMDAIDEWIDNVSQGRANIPPAKIPWDALQVLLEDIIYGGRIDNTFDQARLAAFVRHLFTAKAYDTDFALSNAYEEVKGEEGKGKFKPLVKIPDCTNYEGFKAWINNMEDFKTPELLGLPSNAELMLLTKQGRHITDELLQLQDTHDHDSAADGGAEIKTIGRKKTRKTVVAEAAKAEESKTQRPQWMTALLVSVGQWNKKLPRPNTVKGLPKGEELERMVENPLFRCMQREFHICTNLLTSVVNDLDTLKNVLEGTDKANNHIRELFKNLRKDKVPAPWCTVTPALRNLTPTLWIEDLARKVDQVQKIIQTPAEKYGTISMWLGGLFSPEAFVAASRQTVARAQSWSLEQVHLQVSVNDTSDNKNSFTFEGLKLHGAKWLKGALAIANDKAVFPLASTRFTWVRKDPKDNKTPDTLVNIPVYLDASRATYLFSVGLKRPEDVLPAIWSQRGTSITVWSSADEDK
jgi:dynein heavy chain 1